MIEGLLGRALLVGSAAGAVLLSSGESPAVANVSFSEPTGASSSITPESYPPDGRIDCTNGGSLTVTKSGHYAFMGTEGLVGQGIIGGDISPSGIVHGYKRSLGFDSAGGANIRFFGSSRDSNGNTHEGARFIPKHDSRAKALTVYDAHMDQIDKRTFALRCAARRLPKGPQIDTAPLY